MRALLKGLLVVLAMVTLQAAVLPRYLEPAFKPDLLLVLMVYLALRSPTSVSLPTAYGLGLLEDCLGGIYLGLNGFSFLVVYLVMKSLSERLYVQSCLLFVLAVSAATTASLTINLALLFLFSQHASPLVTVLNVFVPHLLVNAFVASLLALIPDCGTVRTTA